MSVASPTERKPTRFRARSFVAFALTPEAPIDGWFDDLDRWTENSPGFFKGRPVVLDLSLLDLDRDGLKALVARLGERGIRVYAVESPSLDVTGPDLPPLLSGAKPATIEEPSPKHEPVDAAGPEGPVRETGGSASLIVKAPVRSGQSIFHPHGDVIVLGSAASGSEIIAGGSVHVYGTLRGSVFAGALGDREARIFCRRNEAELLAVDEWYCTADDMEPATRGKPMQAFLNNGVVQVTALHESDRRG